MQIKKIFKTIKTIEHQHCFEDQAEYNSFLAWAIEGSCLIQRMQESSGGVFEIPDYWFYWKQALKLNTETKLELDAMIRKLSPRLDKRYKGQLDDA